MVAQGRRGIRPQGLWDPRIPSIKKEMSEVSVVTAGTQTRSPPGNYDCLATMIFSGCKNGVPRRSPIQVLTKLNVA